MIKTIHFHSQWGEDKETVNSVNGVLAGCSVLSYKDKKNTSIEARDTRIGRGNKKKADSQDLLRCNYLAEYLHRRRPTSHGQILLLFFLAQFFPRPEGLLQLLKHGHLDASNNIKLADYDVLYDKVPIFCDNTSSISISNNPVLHSRTKHIDIRYHFIKDHILKGDIELHFVPTDMQLVDIFTKPLAEPSFTRLVTEL
ncbi:hypothetical protein Tco_1173822, partial [Tanacetum coccineum]